MSFSKAKLQRFNEMQNGTPSPADYNVSHKSRVAGAVISKSDRFIELRSPVSSDNGSFISAGAPIFRTPNPPLKTKSQSNVHRKTKPVDLFETSQDLEALKEKIVECNNKDLYIQEITEQVEDLKQQLSDLSKRLAELSTNKSQLEDTLEKLGGNHEARLNELQGKHRRELSALNEIIVDLKQKMEQLKREYRKLKDENSRDLSTVLLDVAKLEQLHETLTQSYVLLMEQKTKELEVAAQQINDLEEQRKQLEKEHTQQVDELVQEHKVEIQEFEFEMLKAVTTVQGELTREKQLHDRLLKETRAQFEQDKVKLSEDFAATIKQREENYKEANVLAEIQMKERCAEIESSWQLKVTATKDEADAILKECQAIAEYNIIQCEVEKNKALFELSEQKKEFEQLEVENNKVKAERDDLDGKYRDLQVQLSNVIVELNNVRAQSAQEAKEYEVSLEQATKDKHMYEITISKTHKTIEALKNRLMNSDRDVEQLKAELEATEMSKLEVEGKCNKLMDELQIVAGLCDVVEEQNELAVRVAAEKVASLERELLEKVEYFKNESNKQISSITEELNKTKKELADAMEHLHEQQKVNNQAQSLIFTSQREIERLESISSEYTVKICHLEAAYDNAQEQLAANSEKEASFNKTSATLVDENQRLKTVIELMQASEDDLVKQVHALKEQYNSYELHKAKAHEYEREVEEANSARKQYIDLSGKYDQLLQKLEVLENENGQLRKTIAEQESLIGPFREHLQAYEMEYSALMNQKQNAEQEAREMGMKYAQILGHQNQKQKIKHMIDLKKKNFDLAQNNKHLENKLRAQSRTIETLKKELSAVKSPKKLHQPIDNKENVNSPNRTLNSSRIDSPSVPLRDRN